MLSQSGSEWMIIEQDISFFAWLFLGEGMKEKIAFDNVAAKFLSFEDNFKNFQILKVWTLGALVFKTRIWTISFKESNKVAEVSTLDKSREIITPPSNRDWWYLKERGYSMRSYQTGRGSKTIHLFLQVFEKGIVMHAVVIVDCCVYAGEILLLGFCIKFLILRILILQILVKAARHVRAGVLHRCLTCVASIQRTLSWESFIYHHFSQLTNIDNTTGPQLSEKNIIISLYQYEAMVILTFSSSQCQWSPTNMNVPWSTCPDQI